jgi:hypothetical protein
MTRLPGTRTLALAERLLDRATIESVVEPTVADMQHEVERAGADPVVRSIAAIRGYAALVRILVFDGLIWRFPMRHFVTVLLLGALGSALVLIVARVARGPEPVAAMLAVAVLTPFALRLTQRNASFGRMFASCVAVGLMMGTTLWLWTLVDAGAWRVLPWYANAWTSAFLVGCIGFGSALAAAVAWTPSDDSLVRRRILHVLVAAGSFLGAEAAMYVVAFARVTDPFWTASWLLFLSFFFVAVSVAVYLPALLGIKRFVRGLAARLVLPVIGGLLFPVPLLGLPLLQGRLGTTWDFLVHHPGTMATVGSPYALAGAVLGLLLAVAPRGGDPRRAPRPA